MCIAPDPLLLQQPGSGHRSTPDAALGKTIVRRGEAWHSGSVSPPAVMSAWLQEVAFGSEVTFDAPQPDGTMRKVMDTSRLAVLGWMAWIGLEEGPAGADRCFLENEATIRKA